MMSNMISSIIVTGLSNRIVAHSEVRSIVQQRIVASPSEWQQTQAVAAAGTERLQGKDQ